MIYDITELIPLQEKLDQEIAARHGVSYGTTSNKRLLALMVELAELANATRTFKFWSNKGFESAERILDETADVLHFYLSIFIEMEISVRMFDISLKKDVELTDLFIYEYNLLSQFCENREAEVFIDAFKVYLLIAALLGIDNSELHRGYRAKLKVNYSRQDHNY